MAVPVFAPDPRECRDCRRSDFGAITGEDLLTGGASRVVRRATGSRRAADVVTGGASAVAREVPGVSDALDWAAGIVDGVVNNLGRALRDPENLIDLVVAGMQCYGGNAVACAVAANTALGFITGRSGGLIDLPPWADRIASLASSGAWVGAPTQLASLASSTTWLEASKQLLSERLVDAGLDAGKREAYHLAIERSRQELRANPQAVETTDRGRAFAEQVARDPHVAIMTGVLDLLAPGVGGMVLRANLLEAAPAVARGRAPSLETVRRAVFDDYRAALLSWAERDYTTGGSALGSIDHAMRPLVALGRRDRRVELTAAVGRVVNLVPDRWRAGTRAGWPSFVRTVIRGWLNTQAQQELKALVGRGVVAEVARLRAAVPGGGEYDNADRLYDRLFFEVVWPPFRDLQASVPQSVETMRRELARAASEAEAGRQPVLPGPAPTGHEEMQAPPVPAAPSQTGLSTAAKVGLGVGGAGGLGLLWLLVSRRKKVRR